MRRWHANATGARAWTRQRLLGLLAATTGCALMMAPLGGGQGWPGSRGTVWVTNQTLDTVAAYDARSGALLRTLSVGAKPIGVVAPPGTRKVYVANEAAVPVWPAATIPPKDPMGGLPGGSCLRVPPRINLVPVRLGGGLAGGGDHELAHHAVVLVAQQVAVEHVGDGRVGVVAEADQEPRVPARRDEHGVLPAVQGRRPRAAGVVDDLELHVVDVEAVRVPRLVADLPDLGAAGGHGLVDAAHVHLPAVDGAEAVEREGARPADGTRVEPLVADEPLRDRRRRRQRRRGAHLQQVEAAVTAGEAVLERVGTKVWREAAQNGPLARPEGGDHLGALAGRQGHAGDAPWRVEQAAVAADQVEGAAVPEADREDAGGRGVEQPEAHALAGHVQMGVVGAVDQGGAAEPADRVERPVGEVEPALAVEVLVLDDQGDVVDAVALGQRQRARLGVVEQEH